ncbi:MAG: crossover junction endodeoxyribonuclease RuvC [Alphaproteobacteria bacterium]|nr:crossover junction endodeoxyribonuclease RuvC [Alphaproteobacteria bacterium]TAD91434.1 MAG: crossover junction endodeoxyribonuclease RuvC [Alphaproteobacteria bacterium]
MTALPGDPLTSTTRRILGLDPGLRRTGWGIVDVQGMRLGWVASGVITSTTDRSLAERLAELYARLEDVIVRFQPTEAAVEETFVNKNPDSTLKLGQARGIALLAPARMGLTVAEYNNATVKKAVVGTGAAEKDQVAMMVHRLLPGVRVEKADATDALAIAICHAHTGRATAVMARARVLAGSAP